MNIVRILTTPSARRTKLLLKAIDGSNRLQQKLVKKADRMERSSRRKAASRKKRSR